MVQWGADSPGAGDLDEVRSAATRAQGLEATSVQVGVNLGVAQANVAQVWSGGGGAEWFASADGVRADLSLLAVAARAGRDALYVYVAAVEGIQSEFAAVRRSLDRVLGEARRWGFEYDVDLAVPTVRQLVSPAPSDPGYHRGAQVEQELWSLAFQASDLADRRGDADRTLRDALAEAAPPRWVQRRAVFAEAGVDVVSEMTPERYAELLARRVASESRAVATDDLSPETVELLEDFFASQGRTPAGARVFFDHLGGREAVLLVQQLGSTTDYRNPVEERYRLAEAVRAGLSVSMQDWSDARVESFTAGMLDVDPRSRQLSSVAFLLAGPPVVDPRLAREVFARFDEWERADRRAIEHLAEPRPGAWTDVRDIGMDGGWSLLLRDAREHGREVTRDLGAIVLTAVATHPELIGDVFLDDDAVRRRQWWFRDRDWTDSGFQAPARVLAASQQSRGGPYDPDPHPAALQEAALLLSLLGENLTRNVAFDAHDVDPEAKIDVAIALAPHHGAFVAAENAPSGRETDTSQGRWMVSDAPGTEGRIVPVLEANVLVRGQQEYGFRELYGIAGSSPQGRQIIECAQAAYYHELSTQHRRAPGDLSDLAERVIISESLVNASINAEDVDSAVSQDAAAVQRSKDAVAALGVMTGGVSLPGGAGIAMGVAAATTAGQSALEAWLTEQVATGTDATITAITADEDARFAHAKVRLATTVAAALGLDVPPPTAAGALGDAEPSRSHDPATLEQKWLDQHYEAIEDAYQLEFDEVRMLNDVLTRYDESVDGTEDDERAAN